MTSCFQSVVDDVRPFSLLHMQQFSGCPLAAPSACNVIGSLYALQFQIHIIFIFVQVQTYIKISNISLQVQRNESVRTLFFILAVVINAY